MTEIKYCKVCKEMTPQKDGYCKICKEINKIKWGDLH